MEQVHFLDNLLSSKKVTIPLTSMKRFFAYQSLYPLYLLDYGSFGTLITNIADVSTQFRILAPSAKIPTLRQTRAVGNLL